MIGSVPRKPGGNAVSDPIPDRVDSDPLLEFSSEPEPKNLRETAPEDALDPLRQRVETLERSLELTARELRTLGSQVATLVSATSEINRRLAPRALKVKPRVLSRGWYRAASAVTGALVGIAAAAWLWTHYSAVDPVVMNAAPAPVSLSVESAAPAQHPVTPPPQASAPVPTPTPTPTPPAPGIIREEPRKASSRIEYVGTLSVDASPGGNVFIDREPAGHTPLRIEKLRAGSHLVWIERDGYRRWTRVVEVPADRVSRAFADLETLAPK